MRRIGGLFTELISLRNLWWAWRDFQRGKRSRPSVRAFELSVDRTLPALHRQLAENWYRPAGYRLIGIHEPKRRLIAAAPVADRVIHHAVHRVLSPCLDRSFLPWTYACLPARGSHRAVLAFIAALRRYRFVLTLDIRHYFLSIDHEILLELMARRLREKPLLALLRTIVESGAGLYRHPGVADFLGLEAGFPPAGCGLPIGNLTSQWWGNHYLDGLDHSGKRELKLAHYQRYMDDFAVFGDSAESLLGARDAMAEWLWANRRLRLKSPGALPRPTAGSFLYLGQRVSRSGARAPKSLLARMRRRVADVVLQGTADRIERSVASYRGILGLDERMARQKVNGVGLSGKDVMLSPTNCQSRAGLPDS